MNDLLRRDIDSTPVAILDELNKEDANLFRRASVIRRENTKLTWRAAIEQARKEKRDQAVKPQQATFSKPEPRRWSEREVLHVPAGRVKFLTDLQEQKISEGISRALELQSTGVSPAEAWRRARQE